MVAGGTVNASRHLRDRLVGFPRAQRPRRGHIHVCQV